MPIKFPNTLSFRLAASIVFIFLCFLVLTFYITLLVVDIKIKGEVDRDLIEEIYLYKDIFEQEKLEDSIQFNTDELSANTSTDKIIRILASNGDILYTSDKAGFFSLDNSSINDIDKFNSNSNHNLIFFSTHQILPNRNDEIRIATGKFSQDTFIQIGETLELLKEVEDLLTHSFMVILITMVIPVLFLSWFISNHATRGIREVNIAANKIKNGKLDSRVIAGDQSEEIQVLSKTFNSMADRISELMNEMREMIDNIAHDLKSPLTRIRMSAEATITGTNSDHQKTAEDTLVQCDKLLQYINATLDVAEAEAGIGVNLNNKIDISEILHDACELFQTLADQKNIILESQIQANCVLYGNNQSLQRMIANIIDNAIKYSTSDTKVIITLIKDENKIILIVSDNGPGISENEINRVFDRFYRCDQSRSAEGSGLGLSYARAVARSHGGDITLKSNTGTGCRFIIELPALD